MSTEIQAGRAQQTPAAGAHVPRYLGLALVVIATAQLMIVLDATIVNVALPHIQRALGFSGSGLEWVVTAYALSFGSLLLLGGRLGDIFGRRRIFMIGILVFTVGSLLGGFATSQAWLLSARVLQGSGGALAAPTALALIATTFPMGPSRNRALGVYAGMSGGGGAVGLLLGGILTTYVSWRWVLFVNVPIGAAVIALAPMALATTAKAAPAPRHPRGDHELRRFGFAGVRPDACGGWPERRFTLGRWSHYRLAGERRDPAHGVRSARAP